MLSGTLDSLEEIIVGALKRLLRTLFGPIRTLIESTGHVLLDAVVSTPYPDTVFGVPSNAPWPAIHEFYWTLLIPLTLSLYGLALGLVILLETTSHLFSNYHRSKLKKRAFSGLIGILSWWWIAAFSLRLTDVLATVLVPPLSEVSLFQTLSFSGIGVLGLVISLSVDLVLFVLIGLIYLMRRLILFLFVLLMPLLIVLWIPGVGPFALVSKFMHRLAGFYVPFLFLTIPVALLFRVGGLLGESASLSATGIGSWLTALVIPFIAVVSPIFLFWQAGLLVFITDRMSQHVSAQRARDRVTRGVDRAGQARHSGRNFVRGVRGQPAVGRDGQTVLGSGTSRSHEVGRRANRASTRLRHVLGGDGSGRDGR